MSAGQVRCSFSGCMSSIVPCWDPLVSDETQTETAVAVIDRADSVVTPFSLPLAQSSRINGTNSRYNTSSPWSDDNDKSMTEYWVKKMQDAVATDETSGLWAIYKKLQIGLLYMSKGSFGVVYGIPHTGLAVKVVQTSARSPRPRNEKMMLEFVAKRQAEGDIVCAPGYYGCGENVEDDKKTYAFFFDREEMSLEKAVRNTMTYDRRLRACILVLKSVKNLHSIGVVHRDIKLKNALCNAKMTRVVLCDFGGACKIGSVDVTQQFTLGHCAPEMLFRKSNFTPTLANDAWAVGVCLCQIFVPHYPWSSSSDDDTKKGSSSKASRRIAEVEGLLH
eukprot:GHVP01056039.1.p1 GENE.GHVP01056039.1~~GHVP01056039.1.p1  ORF type:complete len:334 (-),score=39.92 GHVP01056039.1:146-1147(-)